MRLLRWASKNSIVALRYWDQLSGLLTDTVFFRNPTAFEPYHGKATMQAILNAVFSVFQDFKYLRHFSNETGYVLEFSAQVGCIKRDLI